VKGIAALAAATAALLAATSAAWAPVAPSPAGGQVQILRNDESRIGVRNDAGEWWIAKRCIGSQHWRPLADRTTGPGYVYLVRRAGRVIVEDRGEPILDDANGGRNPYGSSGGLGSFAYQHARGIPPFTFDRRGGMNTWWVSSRICAPDHPQTPGFGVSERCCRVSPLRWDADGAMRFSIDVDLRTPWQDPVLRLRYDYVFTKDAVRLRTTVRSFCADPSCGDAPNQHYVKEPKFTAQVAPVTGDTLAVLDEWGAEVTRWAGGHPRQGTGQVDDPARDSVLFTASGLRIVARSATGRWEGSGSGLDAWAVAASTYAPAPSTGDGPAPVHYATGEDTRWDCNGTSPGADGVRQWELVGGAPGYPLAVFFHGWEGGVGHNDCEPLARHFPPASAAFENSFEFTFGGSARRDRAGEAFTFERLAEGDLHPR
jgi:hypothetical protein